MLPSGDLEKHRVSSPEETAGLGRGPNVNESLFHSWVDECKTLDDGRRSMDSTEASHIPTLLGEYQESAVSSLAKQLGHAIVEGVGVDQFVALERSSPQSGPIALAFRVLS